MNRVGRRCAFGVIVVGLALGIQSPAWAGDPNDDGCLHEANPDLKIGYCTRVIQSGRYIGANAAWAFNNRGNGYHRKGEDDHAIQDYDEAIRLKPDFALAFNNRGNAYSDKGDYDRAIQDLDKAIRLKPDYALAFNNRAIAYSDKGQYDRAIHDFTEAIHLKPDDAEVLANRGTAY